MEENIKEMKEDIKQLQESSARIERSVDEISKCMLRLLEREEKKNRLKVVDLAIGN